MPDLADRRRALALIVLAQFAGTSLWFCGNAVSAALLPGPQGAAWLASAVQLGFVAGTLLSSALRLADRHPPRHVFLLCCVLGAAANDPLTRWAVHAGDDARLLGARFVVGMALAGIYPVGIKLAAGWSREGLGVALGLLVGALVLGTAFPYLVSGLGAQWPWEWVLGVSSGLAVASGLVMLFAVRDGPYARPAPGAGPATGAWRALVVMPRLRASALGYFGHMWELYAFWAFLPLYLGAHMALHGGVTQQATALWTFAVIAAGAAGSVAGGFLSLRWGSAPMAFAQLSVSGLCCLLSPLAFLMPTPLFLAFLLLWGVCVVGDSPQFSALNAREAPAGSVGSVVTLINSLGFAISFASIQLLGLLHVSPLAAQYAYLALAPGPVLGLLAFRSCLRPAAQPVAARR